MGLVSTWLTGIGLAHAVPNFKAAGIVTPADLAELDLSHYEALGVREASDRKKLFYLVQRIKLAVDEEENQKNGGRSGKSPKKERLREEERRLASGGGGGGGGARRIGRNGSSSSSDDYGEREEEEEYEDDYCSEGADEGGEAAEAPVASSSYKYKTASRGGGGYEASETASASSDSSDLPAPPPEKARQDESYRSAGSSAAAADPGRRRSARIMDKRREREQVQQQQESSSVPSSSQKRGGASARSKKAAAAETTWSPFPDEEVDDDGEEEEDRLRVLSPSSSHATTDENRSDASNRGTASRPSGRTESSRTKAAAKRLSDRRKGRTSEGGGGGNRAATLSQRAAADTTKGNSASAKGVGGGHTRGREAESTQEAASEDDSDWDDLVGPPSAPPAAAAKKKSAASSSIQRRAAAPAAESIRNSAQRQQEAQQKARRTSQRLREKQRRERGRYGLQSHLGASRSMSTDQSDDDDDVSVGSGMSGMSYNSNASSLSARERRRKSAPLAGASAGGGGGRASTGSSASSRSRRKTSYGAEGMRTKSRLEELQASRLAKSVGSSGGGSGRGSATSSRTLNEILDDDYSVDNDDDDRSRASKNDRSFDSSSSASGLMKQPAAPSATKAPRRKPASRLPAPAISTSRTGKKRLSTIPSNRVAPMSPLLSLSASQLERSIGAKQVSALTYDDDDDSDEDVDDVDDVDDDRSASSRGSRESRGRRASALRDVGNSLSGEESSSLPEKAPGHKSMTTPMQRRHQPQPSRSRSGSDDTSGGGGGGVDSESVGGGGRRRAATLTEARRQDSFRGRTPSATRAGRGQGQGPGELRDVSTADSTSSVTSASSGLRRSRLQTPSTVTPKRASKPRIDPTRSLDSSLHSSYHGGLNANASMDLNESVVSASASVVSSASGPVFVHGMPEDDSFKTQISRLREENAREHEEQTGHLSQRQMEDDDDDEDEMRIRVIVRKRPMSQKEAERVDEVDIIHPLDYDGYGRVLVYQPKTRVDLTKEVEELPFAFDNVFDEASDNTQIYEKAVRNVIPGVFEGRWASVFAYGQTGSGKTFTMMGSNMTGINAGTADESNLGLYYLAAQDVFYLANEPEFRHLTVGASLFEIYGGKLFDLLNCRKPIKCLEDHRGKVCFPGLSEHPVSSASELMDVIEAGAANRSTGTTSANADSSRSHAVLQLSLRKKSKRKTNMVEHGRLTFIDLAGSERGADTNKASRTTRMEGAEINTSLLALKEVIRALATGDSMTHIPFRGSKLTQVLKESFVGKNSRSVMVACVAPNMGNCEHTLNTLRYADRVKERDAKTGKLNAAVARASRIRRKEKGGGGGGGNSGNGSTGLSRIQRRPLTAPASSGDLNRLMNQSESSGIGRRYDYATGGHAGDVSQDVSREESEEEWLTNDIDSEGAEADQPSADEDSVTLHEVLDDVLDSETESRAHQASASLRADDQSSRNASSRAVENSFDIGDQGQSVEPKNKEAAKTLISTHRAIMTEMLSMVKREMTLVNCTDSDRETIEEYLVELETAQEKQLSMISTLREALLEYYASRHNPTENVQPSSTQTGQQKQPDAAFLSDDSFEDLRD